MDGQADSFDRQDDMEAVMNDVDEIPLVERNHNHPFFRVQITKEITNKTCFKSKRVS